MHVVQREMPEHVAHVVAEASEATSRTDRLGPPAVRALEVAVLDERDRCLRRTANVVASGSTGSTRSTIGAATRSAPATPTRCGRRLDDAEHDPRSGRSRSRRRPRMPSLRLLEGCRPSKEMSAMSSATVNPMPATVAPPTSGGHGIVSGSRPNRRRVAKPRRAGDPHRLADYEAEHDPERDPATTTASRRTCALELHARVRQREQRDDHVARPRVEQHAVSARWVTPPSARSRFAERAYSGVGCSRNSRHCVLASWRSARVGG